MSHVLLQKVIVLKVLRKLLGKVSITQVDKDGD